MKKLVKEYSFKYGSERDATAIVVLPDAGTSPEKILDRVATCAKETNKFYTDGNISGAIYVKDKEHWSFISDIMRATVTSNPLHLEEFKYVTQMEAEIVRWTLNLYNGDENSCGLVTTGGTESIVLACLAYRDKYRAEKGITKPNIVASQTAHCAFDKAGHYFGIEVRKAKITKDCTADIA